MKSPVDKDTAEIRVIRKYHKVYPLIVELVDALQNLEPGGTLVDDAMFITKANGKIQMAYKARPVRMVIDDGRRKFTLRVDELAT